MIILEYFQTIFNSISKFSLTWNNFFASVKNQPLIYQGYYVALCPHALAFPATDAIPHRPRPQFPGMPAPPRELTMTFRPKLLPRGSSRHSPHPFGRFGSLTGGLMTTAAAAAAARPRITDPMGGDPRKI